MSASELIRLAGNINFKDQQADLHQKTLKIFQELQNNPTL